MKKQLLLLITFCCLFQCKTTKDYTPISIKVNKPLVIQDSLIDKTTWQNKDIIDDSIPGISLDKALNTILKDKKESKKIIVAVIDTEVDINHEALQQHIWSNKNEIPNNNIDDDDNGYIDDINGWNFIGNIKGQNTKHVHFAYTRILKKYKTHFNNNNTIQDSSLYKQYIRAKEKYNQELILGKKDIAYIDMVSESKKESKKFLSKRLNTNAITIPKIDSLKALFPKDSLLQNYALRMSNFLKYKFTNDYISNYKTNAKNRVEKLLNLDYDEREIIGGGLNIGGEGDLPSRDGGGGTVLVTI